MAGTPNSFKSSAVNLSLIIHLFKKFFLPLVLGAYSQFTLSAEDPPSSELNYDYRDFVYWLKKNSDEKEIPGAALAIVSREGIMYLQTWGVSSVGDQSPITNDSVFRIASMSKTFAGAAAALLVEKNLQSWDKKIADIFPNFRKVLPNSKSAPMVLVHFPK